MPETNIGKRGEANNVGVKINHGLTGREVLRELIWNVLKLIAIDIDL